MDLSNDESAFSYGKMNETIHVNSHIEEEFMMEDVGMYFSYNSSEKSDIIMIENVEELKTQCYGKDLTKMLKILQLKK